MKSNFKSPQKTDTQYLQTFVTPIIDQLISDLLTLRPANVISFSSKWFQELQIKLSKLDQSDQEQEEILKLPAASKRRRGGILEIRQETELEISQTAPKTQYSKSKVLFTCAQLFMFKSFGQEEIDLVMQSMKLRSLKEDAVLFRAKDQIDGLYIVNNGEIKAVDQKQNIKKYYTSDGVIGELSLLYPQTSSYTLIATKQTNLYHLSTSVYRVILNGIKEKVQKELEDNIQLTIFKSMSSLQKAKLATIVTLETINDSIQIPRSVNEEKRIIIVISGRLQLIKTVDANKEVISNYSAGQHIQEQEVQGNKNMILSTKSQCKVLYLKKSAFARLFGPYERFLTRQKASKKPRLRTKNQE